MTSSPPHPSIGAGSRAPRSFPLALKLEGKKCVVVGQNASAGERALNLSASGAVVELVAPAPSEELRELAEKHGFTLHQRPYSRADLAGAWLVVLTDPDDALAAQIASDAERLQLFFCAVDRPSSSTFSHVAIARAGLVTFAISTEGKAPALGRKLREELQRLLDESSLAEFAAALAELREQTPSEARKAVLGAAVEHVELEGRLKLE